MAVDLAELAFQTRRIVESLQFNSNELDVINSFKPEIKDVIADVTYPHIQYIYQQLTKKCVEGEIYNGYSRRFVMFTLSIACIYYHRGFDKPGNIGFLDLIAMNNPTIFNAWVQFLGLKSGQLTKHALMSWIGSLNLKYLDN